MTFAVDWALSNIIYLSIYLRIVDVKSKVPYHMLSERAFRDVKKD